MGAEQRHDRGEAVPAFAARYSDTFPERYLALCPVCGRSVPLFLRRWVEVGIVLNEAGRAPRFREEWLESPKAWASFAWFRW